MSIYVRNHIMKTCLFEDDRHWKKPVPIETHGPFAFDKRLVGGAWHRNSTRIALWSLGTLLGIVGETQVFFWQIDPKFFSGPARKSNRIRICLLFVVWYFLSGIFALHPIRIYDNLKHTRKHAKCCLFVGYYMFLLEGIYRYCSPIVSN